MLPQHYIFCVGEGGGGGAGPKKLGVCPLTSRCSATELFQELHVAHGPVGVLEGR